MICYLGWKKGSSLCAWGAESHDICRFLSVLWFIRSTYVRNENCQVHIKNPNALNMKQSAYRLFCWISFFFSIFLSLEGFRVDGMEDRYSILIRFDDLMSADTFYKHFNGRRFSSLEVCFALCGLLSFETDLEFQE